MVNKMFLGAVCAVSLLSGCQAMTNMSGAYSGVAVMGEEAQAQQKLYGSQPPSGNNPMGGKYIGRFFYAMSYPDAKAVEYGGGSLTAFFELAKLNQNKRVSDEKNTYYFQYSNDGKLLSSCQFDNATLQSTTTMLKSGKGLMEPVLFFDLKDFTLKINKEATKKLHAQLGKVLTLRPLSDTEKYAELFLKIVTQESARRGKFSEERVQLLVNRNAKVDSSFASFLRDIKEGNANNTSGSEFKTIYNVKFKEFLADALFVDVDYLVLMNKDNMTVDQFPNIYNSKVYDEKYLSLQLSGGKQALGQQSQGEVVRAYLGYKYTAENMINIMASGNQFANLSINIVSKERLATLNSTGDKLATDLKFTVTDIDKLDALLDNNIPTILQKRQEDDLKQCYSKQIIAIEGLYSDECWEGIANNYLSVWNYAPNEKIKDINLSVTNNYDELMVFFSKVKEEFQITSGLTGKKLATPARSGEKR